jgi:outer membrane usher protein FimD/PapC
MQWRNEPGFVCHSFSQYGLCNEWAPVGDQQYYFNTQIPYGAQIIPQQCGNPMQDCTGRVTVRASSNQGTVRHNDEYSYSLYVRNDDSQPRVVSVRAYLDDAVYYMNATAGARLDGSIVTWNSVAIPARHHRTRTHG